MKIKILSGHLTVTDKRAVSAMIEAGANSANSARASYVISAGDGHGWYRVEKFVRDRGIIPVPGSPLRMSKYVSEIQVK